MDEWPWLCTSTGQDHSNELDLELIQPVVAEFQCLEIPGAVFMHKGMGMGTWWVNNKAKVAHLQAKMVPVILI